MKLEGGLSQVMVVLLKACLILEITNVMFMFYFVAQFVVYLPCAHIDVGSNPILATQLYQSHVKE